MPAHELQRIVRDLSQFHDTINITCSKEGIQFSTTADSSTSQAKIILRPNTSSDAKESEQVGINKVLVGINRNPSLQVSMELNEPVTMAYASRYVGLISKATPLSASVSLSIKEDQPLLVEYKIGDVGHLRYYLAPKTDQGDNEE